MTTTEREAPEPGPVSIANVAAWRRRRQASEEPLLPPPPDVQSRLNGHQGTDSTTTSGSLNTIASSFDESQRTGLAAMFSLAQAEAPLLSLPAVESRQLQAQLAASAPGFTANGEPARLAPVITRPPALNCPELPRRPVRPAPPHLSTAGTHSSRQRRMICTSPSLPRVPALPLLIILTVQVILSLRLIWSNTAFSDEALYLWAGRLELAHWLHGTADSRLSYLLLRGARNLPAARRVGR